MTLLEIDSLRTSRRTVLKAAGSGIGGLVGMSGSAAARGGGGEYLNPTEGKFALYWDNEEPLSLSSSPFLGGKTEGFFSPDEIRITPGRQTLHHNLAPLAGFLMEDKPKPYTLVNEGEGEFESRGQTINFTARGLLEIIDDLAAIAGEMGADPEGIDAEPIKRLADNRWRAVATEKVAVDVDTLDWEWAATRVDFFSRGGGRPEYELSFLFVLWSEAPPGLASNFGDAEYHAEQLVRRGRLNQGGN